MRHGENIPGLGHPLYPGGDPRAAVLLRLAEASGNAKDCKLTQALVNVGTELLHELPSLDFGLAALSRAYGLPAGAPLMLFPLGRTVGWVAHAIGQYASEELIRPRARHTGPTPENSSPPDGQMAQLAKLP